MLTKLCYVYTSSVLQSFSLYVINGTEYVKTYARAYPAFWKGAELLGQLRSFVTIETFDDKIVLPKIVESLRYEVATFLNPTFELVQLLLQGF